MPKSEVTSADIDALVDEATSAADTVSADGKDVAMKLVADMTALKAALGL